MLSGCSGGTAPPAPSSPTPPSTSGPTLPPGSPPPNGQTFLYTNPAYREVAVSTSTDGKQVVYLGEKDSDGLPIRISEAVTGVQQPEDRAFLKYGADGRLASGLSADGTLVSFSWADNGVLVTITGADGNTYNEFLSTATPGASMVRRSVLIGPRSLTFQQCDKWTSALGHICEFNDAIKVALPLVCVRAAVASVLLGTACGAVGVATVFTGNLWNAAAPPGGSPCDVLSGGLAAFAGQA